MQIQRRRHPATRTLLIFLGIVLLLILAGYGVLWAARGPQRAAQAQAYQLARSKGKLKTTTAFMEYNGNAVYYAVSGTNAKNVPVYALIAKKGHATTVVKQSAGISRKAALQKVWSKRNPKKVLKITLARYFGTNAWEITYLNQKGLLCYEILQFSDGAELKSIINI